VALVDEQDDLAQRAGRDLRRLRAGPFAATEAVLAETCFLLQRGYQRRRLRALLDRLAITVVEVPPTWWDEVFDWLDRYEEHEPDLADAELAVLCSRKPDWRVWTYDREFRTTWRRANGGRIPLAGSTPAR
jgi:predicted nucleic acid-binding protein